MDNLLTKADKKDILGENEISPHIIDLALGLLKEQHRTVKGLYCLEDVYEIGKFPKQPNQNYATVQIHNKGDGTWVVSFCDIDGKCVFLFDTYLEYCHTGLPIISPKVEIEISQLYSFGIKLMLKVPVLPQHANKNYSGLYSIAYAIELCMKKDIEMISFVESELRSHLVKCLQEGKLLPFPKKINKKQPAIHEISIPLICICKRPSHYCKKLIKCINCIEWFHESCFVREDTDNNWTCPKCRTLTNFKNS